PDSRTTVLKCQPDSRTGRPIFFRLAGSSRRVSWPAVSRYQSRAKRSRDTRGAHLTSAACFGSVVDWRHGGSRFVFIRRRVSAADAGGVPPWPSVLRGGHSSVDGVDCREEGHALAEVYDREPTEGGTVVHLRAVEPVSGVRELFQKVVPHNQTHTPPHQQQGSDGDGRLFQCIHRVGGAVSSDQTNTEGQHSKSVRVGDGNKRARVAGSPAGGVEGGNKEPQQRIETICSLVMEFLPLHVLIPLSQWLAKSTKQMWDQAAPSHTRLFIDCATKDDEHCWRSPTEGRKFWQKIPLDYVERIAARLTGLTHITLCYPRHHPMWCSDVLLTIIEAAAAPPAPTQPPPATDQPDRQEGAPATQRPSEVRQSASRLETIAFERVRLSAAEGRELERHNPPHPPRRNEPLTFHSLKAVTGAVGEHSELANRGWLMPSLETVEQKWWDARELGRFISSSRCLRHVGGRLAGEEWASASAAVDRLKVALVSRGCHRSLTQMVVDMFFYDFDSRILPLLQSLASLYSECCRPDDEVRLVFFERQVSRSEWGRYGNSFDLSLFYNDDFPANPSSLGRNEGNEHREVQARKALTVSYTISHNDLINPINSPSQAAKLQAAIDIAKTLTFDMELVSVHNAPDFVPLPNPPSPHTTIIDHLQPFPSARLLYIRSALGGDAGRLVAQMMPTRVKVVSFGRRVSAADRRSVLEALGAEREVGTVGVGWPPPRAVSLADGALDGRVSDTPDDLDPSSVVDGVRGLRRLRRLTLFVWPGEAVRDAVRQLLPTGCVLGAGHKFVIEETCRTGRRRRPRRQDRRITIARRSQRVVCQSIA
ncbi:unnamed protein product, partial [Vitrella brassicaformis CCMP3155]